MEYSGMNVLIVKRIAEDTDLFIVHLKVERATQLCSSKLIPNRRIRCNWMNVVRRTLGVRTPGRNIAPKICVNLNDVHFKRNHVVLIHTVEISVLILLIYYSTNSTKVVESRYAKTFFISPALLF